MTRNSIETAAKVYIVALIGVFIWTVAKVLAEVGIL
jgi:type IV secretory pathway TrbD component